MSTTRGGAELKQQTAFVGLLEDRCLSRPAALGTVSLIDTDRVATCAHLVVPYIDNLAALKVRFAQANKEFGVTQVFYHPQFDVKMASQLAERALRETLPSLALQKNNIAILALSEVVPELSDDDKKALNTKLSTDPVKDQGLSGQLEEVDLALVIQTLTNGRRNGSLVICDERNLTQARMFCKDGRVSQTQFGPLENERAIYQIFNQHLKGKFYFKSQQQPDWEVAGAISRPTDMLLIEAHRRMDEIPELLLNLGGEETRVRKTRPELDLSVISEEVRADAQALWPHIDSTVPIGRLWRLSRVDDYSVFKPLTELLATGHIVQHDVLTGTAPLKAAHLGRHLPLKPQDKIQIVGFDCNLDAARQATGLLLGTLSNNDPWHLVHNLSLPEDAAGAPVLKDGMLIGIHCGKLPTDISSGGGDIRKTLSQFIWSEALLQCGQPSGTATMAFPRPRGSDSGTVKPVNAAAENSAAPAAQVPADPVAPSTADPSEEPPVAPLSESVSAPVATDEGQETMLIMPGCLEMAQVECPRCGSSSLDSARFCKICGQALIDDINWEGPEKKQSGPRPLVPLLVLVVLVLMGAVAYMALNPTKVPVVATSTTGSTSTITSSSQPPPATYTTDNSADAPVSLELQRADRAAGQFVAMLPDQEIKASDLLRVRIKVAGTGFVYVLYQGSSSKKIEMHYPDSAEADSIVMADSVVTIPKEQNPHELSGFALGGPAGTDTLLVLQSPEKLSLPENQEAIDKAFAAGIKLLEEKKVPGVASTTTDLAVTTANDVTAAVPVYAATLKLTHGK